jgi:drug/metabolite transporter (DMT)-like permease
VLGIVLASGPELSGGSSTRAIVLSALAAVCFGAMYITMAEGSKVSPLMTMAGMRAVSGSVVVVVLLVVRGTGGLTRRDIPAIVLIGLFDAGANVTYGYATTMGELSVIAMLGSLYPMVTAVLAAVVLRERLRPVQYAGIALAMAGVVLVAGSG